MLKSGNKVLVYRNGHLLSIGIAGPLREYAQDKIAITYGDSVAVGYIDVDRNTGIDSCYIVKSVSDEEWFATANKLHQDHIIQHLKKEELSQIADEEAKILGDKAEVWYNTLPEEQQKMINALVLRWVPIAVA